MTETAEHEFYREKHSPYLLLKYNRRQHKVTAPDMTVGRKKELEEKRKRNVRRYQTRLVTFSRRANN
jgi:hypothetical protein